MISCIELRSIDGNIIPCVVTGVMHEFTQLQGQNVHY